MTALLLILCPVFAEELDNASQEALQKTQVLLKDKSQRDAYIRDHPEALAADKKAGELGDPADKERAYDISADIYSDIVKNTNGDAKKQKELLDKAAANPEAFYNSLSPSQKAQIHDLATGIQGRHPAAQPKD